MLYPVSIKSSLSHTEDFTKEIDRRFWKHAFSLTGFSKYMDKEARAEFERSLVNNPPAFNMENIRATFLQAYQESELFFNRGLVNIFKRLSGKYKTNDAFKVNKKIIISNWFRGSKMFGLDVNYHAQDEMDDLNRIFTVLDGKDYKEYVFSSALRQAVRDGFYEDEYFKIRMFKNGNAHLWFKRLDLLDMANEIIAKWYGENKLG